MRFMHLSDLHIGKSVNNFSMLEDQKFIFEQIYSIISEYKVECVLIAGDIYDKAMPSAEAVSCFDEFLTRLSEYNIPICAVSGNHDSPERIAFGGRLLAKHNIFLSGQLEKKLFKLPLRDDNGIINVYLMPYVKPAVVRYLYDCDVRGFESAAAKVIAEADINPDERNILVAHQLVTSGGAVPERSESETLSIGGTDNIDMSVFDGFDYVALGHIHRPQHIGRESVRYCGSPIKYSFSEAAYEKSVTLVDVTDKVDIKTVALKPMHDMYDIRCGINDLSKSEDGGAVCVNIGGEYREIDSGSYMRVTLTDEEELYNAVSEVRKFFPNLMELAYDNTRTASVSDIRSLTKDNLQKSITELFADFYKMQNGIALTDAQLDIIQSIVDDEEV